MVKLIGWLMLVFGTILLVNYCIGSALVNNMIMNTSRGYWELADKSSTLEAKCENIDKFVQALDKEKFAANDTLFFPNIDNSYEYNRKALGTLQKRLHEIKKMDPNTLAYATSIQQITAQEQGEASSMISRIYGCLYKEQYPVFWQPYALFWLCFYVSVIFIGGCMALCGMWGY